MRCTGNATNFQWMDNFMHFSKNVLDFVDGLVSLHAKYDFPNKEYQLYVEDLPDYDLCVLSALLMVDNPQVASEALGPDNSMYDVHMLPTLLYYLKDINDQDKALTFCKIWQRGIAHYFRKTMQGLISDALQLFNANQRDERKEFNL